MQHHRFLPGILFSSAAIAAFSFAACGGNVVLDGNTGNGGAGGGAGNTNTNTTSTGGATTVNPVGGSTGDAGSIGEGGGTVACPGTLTYCPDGGCYDLFNDPSHCGSCDIACDFGATCQGGGCVQPTCVPCGEYITNGGELCGGQSQMFYDALINCVCAGKCLAQCSDNVCAGSNITIDCQNCVVDTVAGCGNEFNECANDF